VPIPEELFEGAVSFQRGPNWIKPWRIPFSLRKLFPFEDGLHHAAAIPAGVRLCFQTAARRIALRLVPSQSQRLFDLTADGRILATVKAHPGQEEIVFETPGDATRTLAIWLPTNQPVALTGLHPDDGGSVRPLKDSRAKWITYGSSITHCAGANSPARAWPAWVARKHDLNLTCLGFGGNCHMEPMLARLIRDMPADFVSLKVGINIYTAGSLSARSFQSALIGFVQIIRENHPHIPLAVISPITSPSREKRPGKGGLSLEMMRDHLREAVGRLRDCGDRRVFYFDGRELFAEQLVEPYLPDGVHPNGDGYERLAENFSSVVLGKIALSNAVA